MNKYVAFVFIFTLVFSGCAYSKKAKTSDIAFDCNDCTVTGGIGRDSKFIELKEK